MIIGISGKIGSGKDTVAYIIMHLIARSKGFETSDWPEKEPYEYLVEMSGWEIKKFAGKLKQLVCMLTGCTLEQLENQEFKNKPLPDEWNKITNTEFSTTRYSETIEKITYRTLLQKLGTEVMRDQIHENVWVNALFADYKGKSTVLTSTSHGVTGMIEYPNWIISDMRFPNEMKAVEDHGGITIRIDRDTYFRTGEFSRDLHPSEIALDDAKFKYTIENNDTIEELVEKVKEILIAEKII